MFKWLNNIFKKSIKSEEITSEMARESIETVHVVEEIVVITGVKIGQFMVTNSMRKELRDLGYNKFQIDALSPDQAAERIKNQQGPNG